MCGIAGFFGQGDRGDLAAMATALAHRGPDGEGFHVDDAARVYLGHRRLAILDIAGGHQPMWNEDGTVAVVFNGEIYNHVELRQALQALGHVFASDHSDTEVLVHGYEEWGADLPVRLNGMFAFAIWDARRGRLFLARDRFGEKPLYYAARPDCFAFASELSALVRHPAIEAVPDIRALQKFFAYGYLPGANALYAGTCKLPAGHHLTLDLAGGEPRLAAYWQFRIEPDETLGNRTEASPGRGAADAAFGGGRAAADQRCAARPVPQRRARFEQRALGRRAAPYPPSRSRALPSASPSRPSTNPIMPGASPSISARSIARRCWTWRRRATSCRNCSGGSTSR